MSTIIIGIDISKKKFDVAFMINQKWQHETFENTLEEHGNCIEKCCKT